MKGRTYDEMIEHHLLSTLLEDLLLDGIFRHELEDQDLREKERRYEDELSRRIEATQEIENEPSSSVRIGKLERWPGDLDEAVEEEENEESERARSGRRKAADVR